jgi:hypothetical protein
MRGQRDGEAVMLICPTCGKSFSTTAESRAHQCVTTPRAQADPQRVAEQLVQEWYGASGERTMVLGEDGNRLRAAIAAALAATEARVRQECAEVARTMSELDAARLKRAAPDLLAALQAMVDLDKCEAHIEEAYERVLPQAIAAIAKATGRSQP